MEEKKYPVRPESKRKPIWYFNILEEDGLGPHYLPAANITKAAPF